MSYTSNKNQADLLEQVRRFRDLILDMRRVAALLDVPTVSAARMSQNGRDIGKTYDLLQTTRTALRALSGNTTPSAAEDVLLVGIRNAIRDLQVEIAKLIQATSLADIHDLGAFDGTNWNTLNTDFALVDLTTPAAMRTAAASVVSQIDSFLAQ